MNANLTVESHGKIISEKLQITQKHSYLDTNHHNIQKSTPVSMILNMHSSKISPKEHAFMNLMNIISPITKTSILSSKM